MSALCVGIPQDAETLFVNLEAICYASYSQDTQENRLLMTFPDGHSVEARAEAADEIVRLLSEFNPPGEA